jgi:hypothetical protein
MVTAPTGAEDLVDVTAKPSEVSLSTRSLLRGRLLHIDGSPAIELQDEQRAVTVYADGDRASAAAQLKTLAATFLAAAEELRHYKVDMPLGQHQYIPMCACGQAAGHPNAAFS